MDEKTNNEIQRALEISGTTTGNSPDKNHRQTSLTRSRSMSLQTLSENAKFTFAEFYAICTKLGTLKMVAIPNETIKYWYEMLTKRNDFTLSEIQARANTIAGKQIFNRIDYADWVEGVTTYTETEMRERFEVWLKELQERKTETELTEAARQRAADIAKYEADLEARAEEVRKMRKEKNEKHTKSDI
jgi:uncharacterized protein YfkK (UPF0435 family)